MEKLLSLYGPLAHHILKRNGKITCLLGYARSAHRRPSASLSDEHHRHFSVLQSMSGVSGSNQFICQSNPVIEKISDTHICNACRARQLIEHRSRYGYHTHSSASGDSVNHHQQRQMHAEVKALGAMFLRSGIQPTTAFISSLSSNRNVRWFSSSPSSHQNQSPQGEKQNGDKEPPEEERMPFVARLMLLFWLSFLTYIVLRLQSGDESGMYRFVSWNEFLHDMLAKGEVEEIIVRPEAEMAFIRLHHGAVVKQKKVETEIFTLKIPDADKFEERVRKAEADLGIRRGVAISYQRESSWAAVAVMAIVGLALFLVFRNVVKIQLPNASDMFAGERKAKFVRADLMQGRGITFKDVAGLHEAKVEVMEFVDYLKRPEKYQELGGRIPRGALLLGPPGCGKTLLAKAVATEAKVPFLAMAGSEFVEMLGGLGAARVRDLFKEAKQKAPCIIYIDEIDAIGRKRSGAASTQTGSSSEEEHTLNQLLVEMDGMNTAEGVILLGSTNRSDVLDKALLRPGRFDRHIMIDFPTLAERIETFQMYLGKLKLARPPSDYAEHLAQLSPGMSGADIANICNEAALHAARDKLPYVDRADFDYAVERVIAGVAKKSRVLSVQEKKVVAYHEAGHAVVGWLLQHTDALLKVTIIPRTSRALGFAQYMPTDKRLYSKDEIFERMCMALGGRVAESLTFNSVTSGAQDDLRRVTDMAYKQIRELGMGNSTGLMSFTPDANGFGTKPYSRKLANSIDIEVAQMVGEAYRQTENLLKINKEKLRVVAEALLQTETLTYANMEELIGPPLYGRKQVISTDWGESPTPAASQNPR